MIPSTLFAAGRREGLNRSRRQAHAHHPLARLAPLVGRAPHPAAVDWRPRGNEGSPSLLMREPPRAAAVRDEHGARGRLGY